jgi:hypothetical protein
MPFGKHKGTPLTELPLDYLWWLADNVHSPYIAEAVHATLGRKYVRKTATKNTPSVTITFAGYVPSDDKSCPFD